MAYTLYMHVLPKRISTGENDKYYIGITRNNPQVRWGFNGAGYENQAFGKAIKKYGWSNFKHIILCCDLSETEAKEKEIEYIKKFDSTNPKFGFNVSPGGGVISQETAMKIGESQMGEKNHRYGKHYVFSESHKKHMKEAKTGENNPMYGKKRSEHAKKLTSQKLMGHTVSEETRRKIGEGHKGIKRTPESMQNAWNAVRGKPAKNRRKVFCVETGQAFDCLKDASEYAHISSSSLCKALKNGTLVANYHWEYLKGSD